MKRAWVFAAALCAGCPDNDPPACITVDTTCAPGYVPTFDNVFSNTINVSCGNTNSSCHSTDGHMAGLVMSDEQAAYTNLLAPSTIDPSRKRVDPGDAACSVMIVRTDSPGASYQMPIGDALSDVERCALIQWVQMGAPDGSDDSDGSGE
ncbi:MAG TPA: hypothetical protein VGG74_09230 [Kofleriaceae bacterium]